MISRLTKLISNIYAFLINKINNGNWKLKILINGGLLVILIIFLVYNFKNEYSQISIQKFELVYLRLVKSLLIYGLNFFLFNFAWHLLINGYFKSDMINNICIYSKSQVTKILPTPVWFVSNRLLHYSKMGAHPRAILTATITEILLHMLAGGFLLGVINITPESPITFLYIISVIPLIYIIIAPQTLNFHFFSIDDKRIKRSPAIIIIILFLMTWLLGGVFFQHICAGLGISISLSANNLLSIWIISSLAAYLGSIFLGGIGILREFSLTIMLTKIISSPEAFLISAMARLIIIIGNFIWPLFFIGVSFLLRKINSKHMNSIDIIT